MQNRPESPGSQSSENQDRDEFEDEIPLHTKFMLEYLVNKCNFICDQPCLLAHDGDPKRRKPFRLGNSCWNYIPQQCLVGSECEFQNKCMFAHTPQEVKYHPMIYKTVKCGYPAQNGICTKLGVFCYMAHGEKRKESPYSLNPTIPMCQESTALGQIEANRINLENYSTYRSNDKNHYAVYNRSSRQEVFDITTFKTRICEKKSAHNERICLYYHTALLDRRRKHNFISAPCENVFNLQEGRFEYKECINGDGCRLAHTENEILYHIDKYKKEQCTYKPCTLGDCCPFIHLEQNSKSIKDIEDEIRSLKENYSGLLKCLEENKKYSEKLKKFVCVFCKKKANEALQCGHLICGTCGQQKCCGVSKKPLKILFSK